MGYVVYSRMITSYKTNVTRYREINQRSRSHQRSRDEPEITRSPRDRGVTRKSRDHPEITRSPRDREINRRSLAWRQLCTNRMWTTPIFKRESIGVVHIGTRGRLSGEEERGPGSS